MANNINYKYTIIIPHKNIPQLLHRCLASIPQRDDVQIIVVDDNSDPSIVDFKTLSASYPTVQFIFSKVGKGAGYCRNLGLENASGKWIIFIDADDYLVNDPLGIWDESILNSNSDIIYFRVTSSDCDTMQPASRHIEKEKEFNRLKRNKKHLERYLRFKYTEPWGKIFNHDFLTSHDIKFQESTVANDYLFSVLTGLYAKVIHLENEIFYCVTVRNNSLSHSMFNSKDKLYSRINVYDDIQRLFDNNKIHLYPFYSFIGQTFLRSNLKKSEIMSSLKKLGYNNIKIYSGIVQALFSSSKNIILKKFNIPFCGF